MKEELAIKISSASCLAFLPNLHLAYVDDENIVRIIDETGLNKMQINTWAACQFLKPTCLCWHDDKLYIVDQSRIHVFQLKNNRFRVLNDKCIFLDGMTSASSACVTKDDSVVVVVKSKIFLYRSDGKLVTTFTTEFNHPIHVSACHINDMIFVTDKDRILKFDFNGKNIGQLERKFRKPMCAFPKNDGNILVADEEKLITLNIKGQMIEIRKMKTPINNLCIDTVSKSKRLAVIQETEKTYSLNIYKFN